MTETKRRIAALVIAVLVVTAGALAVSSFAADEADALLQSTQSGN